MAEQNGARPPRRPPIKRHVFALEDMQVERDAVEIFGEVYDFAGPADISIERMAEILRLDARIKESDFEQAVSDADADAIDAHLATLSADENADLIGVLRYLSWKMREQTSADQQEERGAEMLQLLSLRTAAIFADTVPDDVRQRLSMRDHKSLYASFRQASKDGGQRLAGAMMRGRTAAVSST